MKRYSNQNHAVHRTDDGLSKVASVYDRQGISNRVKEEKALSFSSLAPFESEAIINTMKKEAAELNSIGLDKQANILSNPFEAFGHAKYYISSKLGLTDEVAHDLASSVVARAQDLQQLHGGEVNQMISGIVDHMNPDEVHSRVGAAPMRKMSPNEVEELIKERLIEQLQMTAYQADQFKKIVVQQARNMLTQYRGYDLAKISEAIVNVLIEHQDASIAYGISTSDRLRAEVEFHLKKTQ